MPQQAPQCPQHRKCRHVPHPNLCENQPSPSPSPVPATIDGTTQTNQRLARNKMTIVRRDMPQATDGSAFHLCFSVAIVMAIIGEPHSLPRGNRKEAENDGERAHPQNLDHRCRLGINQRRPLTHRVDPRAQSNMVAAGRRAGVSRLRGRIWGTTITMRLPRVTYVRLGRFRTQRFAC